MDMSPPPFCTANQLQTKKVAQKLPLSFLKLNLKNKQMNRNNISFTSKNGDQSTRRIDRSRLLKDEGIK